MEKKYSVEITPKTIIMAILIVAMFVIALQLYQIFITAFIAFILASALGPILDFFIKKRIPKALAILIIYVIMFIIGVFIILGIAVPIVNQVQKLITNLPEIITSILTFVQNTFPSLSSQLDINSIINLVKTNLAASQITSLLGNFAVAGQSVGNILIGIGNVFVWLFGSIFNVFMVIVLSGYLLSERGMESREKVIILSLLGNNADRIREIYKRVQEKLGNWLRGQLLLCLFSALINWALFSILGFDFAILIAIIAGVLVAIPTIGPAVLTPTAALIALGTGGNPILVLAYIITYGIYQQLENIFINPFIMRKSVGINPIITLVGVLIGTQLAGIPGALITIPAVAIVQIILEDKVDHQKTYKAIEA
ncbi:MAG: AI-2E family transporter [bacterium]